MNFNIEVRDPQEIYIKEIMESVKNKHFNLSLTDIHVCALMHELTEEINMLWIGPENLSKNEKLICLTTDNGIKSALSAIGLYGEPEFIEKIYKLRCFVCFAIYDKHVDFCKRCGHPALTRVTVIKNGDEEVLCLKKNYNPKLKMLKDRNGNDILSEDSKEYAIYKKGQKWNKYQ